MEAGNCDEGGVGGMAGEESQFGVREELLRPLFMAHKMVIDKAQEISSLKR